MGARKYRVIDLFSGCGGISKGFFDTGKVEIVGAVDFDLAACNTFKKNFPDASVFCGDINSISVNDTHFADIDIIIGGPPCQGFSGLNRWEKDKDNDPRNKLFLQYLRFVDELRPKALLIENVKQILTSKDGYVPKHITSFLSERGYHVSYQILNASDFGVPQKRERAFFVAIDKKYSNFDFVILEKFKRPKVTVREALSDISAIESQAMLQPQGSVFQLGQPESEYQKIMQADNNQLYNHMIYYPADNVQKMISYVPEGGNWKCVPKELFKSDRDNRHSNYLKRLDSQSQSVTIPTIRESARLQSFPDDFLFTGNKGQQFRQVGNAVPPLLANALAMAIMEVLESNEKI